MQNISIARIEANVELLDFELKLELPNCYGVSVDASKITIHLEDNATQADIDTAKSIVENHDKSKLTVVQQKQQQRKLAIEQGRIDYAMPIDTNIITLVELSRRVAWLEEELRELKGL